MNRQQTDHIAEYFQKQTKDSSHLLSKEQIYAALGTQYSTDQKCRIYYRYRYLMRSTAASACSDHP